MYPSTASPQPMPPMATQYSTGNAGSTSLEALTANLPYVDRPRMLRDVRDLLSQLTSLSPTLGQLTSNSGYTDTLLNLTGTIPIWFRNSQYNIPLIVWLPLQYSQRPPICYVTPTRDMRIKDRHKHVDLNGLVYLPYLNQWLAQSSSLAELISVMSSIFSSDPPVFKQSTSSSKPQASPTQQYHATSPQSAYNRLPSIQQSPDSVLSQPPASTSSYLYGSDNNMRSPQPAPSSSLPSSSAFANNNTDERAHKKERLVNELSKKLHSWLTNYHSTSTRDIEDMIEKRAALELRQQQLEQQVSKLQDQQKQLDDAYAVAQIKVDELKKHISENGSKPRLHVDDAVYARDTWSRQLLEACVEDAAIEDTMHTLDRMLNDGKIDVTTHLRQIRLLARRQYFARAIALKIAARQSAANGGNNAGGNNSMVSPQPPAARLNGVPSDASAQPAVSYPSLR